MVLPITDRVQVCSLVLGPVAGVAEGLQAAGVLTDVRFLSRVAPQVDFQILQAGKSLGAAFELKKKYKYAVVVLLMYLRYSIH